MAPGLHTGQQRDAGSVLPLSERAADVSVPVASLLSWHQQAVAQAQAVGTKHAEADGGPTAEDLLVTWSHKQQLYFCCENLFKVAPSITLQPEHSYC